MNSIRGKILNDIVEIEFFHTYTIDKAGNRVYTYEAEYPNDKDKFEAEGSTWIVFIYDCLSEYYHRNKEHFDDAVDKILRKAIADKPA